MRRPFTTLLTRELSAITATTTPITATHVLVLQFHVWNRFFLLSRAFLINTHTNQYIYNNQLYSHGEDSYLCWYRYIVCCLYKIFIIAMQRAVLSRRRRYRRPHFLTLQCKYWSSYYSRRNWMSTRCTWESVPCVHLCSDVWHSLYQLQHYTKLYATSTHTPLPPFSSYSCMYTSLNDWLLSP